MSVNCGVRLVIRRNGNSALSVPGLRVKGRARGGPVRGGDATPRAPKVGYPLMADLNVRPKVRTKTRESFSTPRPQACCLPLPLRPVTFPTNATARNSAAVHFLARFRIDLRRPRRKGLVS